MPYINQSEYFLLGSAHGSGATADENQSNAHNHIFEYYGIPIEKKNFLYAYWNLQKYKQTHDKAYFTEARKYFEKITNPFSEPRADVDFRNQAHLYFGDLWKVAYQLRHHEFSENDRCDPRHHAVKHYQKVADKIGSADDGMLAIIALQSISTLYLADKQSFPQDQQQIVSPGFFKGDHLKCVMAAIEAKAIHNRFYSNFPNQGEFQEFASSENIDKLLSPYLNINELNNNHLIFLQGHPGALSVDQQYKIARTCYDRKLISAENFHAILKYIHEDIRQATTKDHKQLRRNVKYYLASISLKLYYQRDQSVAMQKKYLADLTGIYNDLIGIYNDHIGTKKALYRQAIADRKPKALEAQGLISDFLIEGSQKIPYSDPLTHGTEITSPLMAFMATLFSLPFIALGFIVDFLPRFIFSAGAIALEVVALPFLIFIGIIFCGSLFKGSIASVLEFFILPLFLLATIFKPWASRDSGIGVWGQRIENRWLDTGFTFIFKQLGRFLGNVVGFFVGIALSVVTYLPRLFIQGCRNLVRSDSELAKPDQIQAVLNENRLALDIEKAPLDYLRHNKQFRNYQDNLPNESVEKYNRRFRLFPFEKAGSIRLDHSPAHTKPTAPPASEVGISYEDYMSSVPAYMPSNQYD